jgi:hypothetical protein
MRREQWRAHLMEIVQRFEGRECACRCAQRPPCEFVSKCARAALLDAGEELIVTLRRFGLRDKDIAGYAKTHKANISKWAGGRDEPRLGFGGLLAAIGRLSDAISATRERYAMMAMSAGGVQVKTLDFCAEYATNDKVKKQADDTLRSNIISIVLDQPAAKKTPLPKGIHAHVAQLGNPSYNIFVIQHADPCGCDDAASIQIYDDIIHELNDFIQRLKDRRDRLGDKDQPAPRRPLRIS